MRFCVFIFFIIAIVLGGVGCQPKGHEHLNASVEKDSASSPFQRSALEATKNPPSKENAGAQELPGSRASAEALRQKQLAQQYDDELDRALNGPDDAGHANFGGPTKLRESYGVCVNESRGATPNILDCNAEEYKYQDSRLNGVYRSVMAQLDAAKKQKLLSEERAWIVKRDQLCNLNGQLGGGQAEDIEESSCRLNATARRADELEGRQASR